MDTLSHYLWTVAMYWQHPKRWFVGLSGALPDLLSFGPHLAISALTGGYAPGRPELHAIPPWVFGMYDLTHSFVVFAAVFVALLLWRRELALLTLGWPLHIVMDIPTHSGRFFPTPYLWPLPHPIVDGMSFMTPWFFVSSWAMLIGVYAWLVWKVPRDGEKSSKG